MTNPKELSFLQLKNNCSIKLEDKDWDKLEPVNGIIGQDRAVRAIDFGLQVKMKGYNIYVSGPAGTGKTTYAKKSTEEIAKSEKEPDDWCYVYNFEDPRSPMALRFQTGMGKQFRDDMAELVEVCNHELQKAFQSEEYEDQKNVIVSKMDKKRDKIIKKMSKLAKEYNFSVKSTNSGIYFLPIINGKTIDEDAYEDLEEEQKEEISKCSDMIQEKAAGYLRDIREEERKSKKETEDLDYKIGMFAIGHYISALQEKYKEYSRVLKYLEALQEDILDHIEDFLENDSEEEESLLALLPVLAKKNNSDTTSKYHVNLVVDNANCAGAPVVLDFNPTYYNLVGEVEYDNEFGNLTTDYMKIKPGLLHKANGGYLIVQARDILSNIQSWEALCRVIRTKEIAIENLREQLGGLAVTTLKPEPIPASLKIIMIGSRYYYELLREFDDDFEKYFKIMADFDYEMPRTDETICSMAQYIKMFALQENTGKFEVDAISLVIEYASRVVERQDKLSTRFNQLSDILCEAATWSRLDHATSVTASHVKKAIEEKEQRLRMYEEKFLELLYEKIIMIDTDGAKIGQINGLAVYDLGSYEFGIPTRITATTYLGEAGIVNIEKEAELSGPTHDKGVQVITGYLGQTYAQEFPLSLSCRICFEQNYNGIDGDSASSTELYCLLSSLSDLPIRQDIAVTGSVNQRGEIQAIGGVTFKIEGFFDLCKKNGLTGKQGVLIPSSNCKDLVCKDEIVEAVKNGLFHIYPIMTIDEGIEVLTGVSAGKRGKTGKFPAKSVHGLVYKKLKRFYDLVEGETETKDKKDKKEKKEKIDKKEKKEKKEK